MHKAKYKIGISPQENYYQLSKMIQLLSINNFIVLIIPMMELDLWQLAANLLLESMIKSRGKKWFNLKNLMHLIIAIPTESIVRNSIEIQNSSIWSIQEDGIKLSLLGISDNPNLWWVFLVHTFVEMGLLIVDWTYWLHPGVKVINYNNGNLVNVSWMKH